MQEGYKFIFTCKPDSHPQFSERVAFWQATEARAAREEQHWNGRFTEVTRVRSLNDVLLRRGAAALAVHWFDLTVIHAPTGAQLSDNSCITHHRLTPDHAVHVAPSGRGRWKSDNDNHHVLKTKGDHLEHTFGQGKQ